LFLVEKNNKPGDYYAVDETTVTGHWRGCLNAKPLNPFLKHGNFKQSGSKESQATVAPTSKSGGTYMSATDVKSAFNTLALSDEPLDLPGPWAGALARPWGKTSSRDLGCFNTCDKELLKEAPYGYQTVAVMFGFSPAPYYWQKAYSLVRQDWTKRGAGSTSTIMDDNLIAETDMYSKETAILRCLRATLTVVQCHVHFGVPLSPKDEEAIYPATVRLFGGCLIDAANQRLWVAEEKRKSILRSIRKVYRLYKNRRKVSAKLLAAVVGKVGAATEMLFGVRLFTNQLQRALTRILGGTMIYARQGFLHTLAGDQLQFLLEGALKNFNGRMMIHGKRVDQKITSDFSGVGWGAVLTPTDQVPAPAILSVKLPRGYRKVWSGAGETMVGAWAVKAYARHYNWHDCIVLLVMDNIAAICYFNHWGHSSDEEINEILRPFWEFCRLQAIYVLATYCPGAIIVADEPSRRKATIWEYYLLDKVFQQLEQLLLGRVGAVTFDLFASHSNAQTKKFASLMPDPECTWVDSMKHPWHTQKEMYYAFPPPMLTALVLGKVVAEKQTILLVSPAWTKQHISWIAALLIEPPVLIPWTMETVINPHEGRYQTEIAPIHSSWERWLLVGYLISGDTDVLLERRRELRKHTLQKWLDRQPILTKFTTNGTITAKAYQWIQLMHRLMLSSAQ